MGLVVLASVALGVAAYMLMSHTLMDHELDDLQLVARYAGQGLDVLVSTREQMLGQIAQGEPVTRFVQKSEEPMLTQYLGRFKQDFPFLAYVNKDGQEELKLIYGVTTDARLDVKTSALFQLATSQPNTPVTLFPRPHEDLATATVDFAFCRKNFFDEMEGVIIGRVPLRDMAQCTQDFHFGRRGYAMLLDRQATILAHPDQNALLKTITLSGSQADDMLARAEALGSGSGRVTILGVDSLVAYVPVPQRSWIAVAVIPHEEYMAGLRSLRDVTVLTTVVVLGVSLLLASALTGAVTRPVSELVAAVHRVAQRDLSHRVTVPSDDEIGDLCRSFNRMIEDLQRTTTSIDSLNGEIAERLKAEQRQTTLIEQMEAVNKELQQFAYVVAHDLRTPLRGIKTLAHWISVDCRDKLDDGNKESLDLLGRRVERMDGLIDGILQYSRVSRTEEEAADVDLKKLVPEVIDMIAPPGHVRITVAPNLPVMACGKTRLAQVFQNLISNAVKYMDKPEGQIHVGCTAEGEFWRFSVADNGPGIEEQHFETIFKLFQTLVPRDQRESTGIGLTITKKIVEQYGGRIWLESEVGKGSTFFFTLPQHPEVPKVETAPSGRCDSSPADRGCSA